MGSQGSWGSAAAVLAARPCCGATAAGEGWRWGSPRDPEGSAFAHRAANTLGDFDEFEEIPRFRAEIGILYGRPRLASRTGGGFGGGRRRVGDGRGGAAATGGGFGSDNIGCGMATFWRRPRAQVQSLLGWRKRDLEVEIGAGDGNPYLDRLLFSRRRHRPPLRRPLHAPSRTTSSSTAPPCGPTRPHRVPGEAWRRGGARACRPAASVERGDRGWRGWRPWRRRQRCTMFEGGAGLREGFDREACAWSSWAGLLARGHLEQD